MASRAVDVTIVPLNQVHVKIIAQKSTLYELSEKFTFFAKDYKHSPKFKARMWDGKIRLFSLANHTLYRGLTLEVIKFCKERGYTFDCQVPIIQQPFSLYECEQFIKTLNLPSRLELRDYQIETVADAVRFRQICFESATSSGKSLMIYLIYRYINEKTLLIVPDTGLVDQMTKDIHSYGYDQPIHQIFSGQSKQTNCNLTVTTWQSIWQLDPEWFDQFNVVIADEAHKYDSKCLIAIMSKLFNCENRFGFTGSLGTDKLKGITVQGLIGPKKHVISARELIDQNHAADVSVKCITFNYTLQDQKHVMGLKYHDELKWIVQNERRNKFIKNLALSLKGNTLLLYQHIAHGQLLKEMIEQENPQLPLFYVDQKVKGEQRSEIREQIDKPNQNSLTFATYKIFSTGININNLNNLVLCSPLKAEITMIQSIGRILRKSDHKNKATIIDLSDDLSTETYTNTTLKHFFQRISIYNKQQHPYKLYNVTLS